MESINTTIQYILFSSISNILNDALSTKSENIDHIENLVKYYTENYGEKSECLVAKLEMLKNNMN
ncbi:hypothetical protein [Alkalithermobacter paradoxus]|uniref:Uncharacterized protein n=1 Tax=Alkalithermobacter paradoxus TaxID=29349 RepID=A0A1V4IBS1_9FIRM|nr:hypothetical protein CLOTH_05870 [[Clostridium] thermoalcaliphilum]